MMTGTPTVNSPAAACEMLALCCIAGFAAYDLRRKRVPDRALAFFCPIALMAPLASSLPWQGWQAPLSTLAFSSAGAATGFFTLLAAAMASKESAGIGGGDIKLAAAIGVIYGPYRMLAILLVSSTLASVTALILCRKQTNRALSLPFVPFLAIGSLAATLAAAL